MLRILSMRVISWNINSVRMRLPRLLGLLDRHKPDVVCLQETKTLNRDFPVMELGAVGYRSILHGQKSYNGVAILVRGHTRQYNLLTRTNAIFSNIGEKTTVPLYTDEMKGFQDDPAPDEARVISACIKGFRFVNAYVINGESMESSKFELKRRWMSALGKWLKELPNEPPLVVVGDFNVAPADGDVWDPIGLKSRIHCTKEERMWLSDLQGNRLLDLLRSVNNEPGIYTWWPYTNSGFDRNEGLRFDLALGDKKAAESVNRVWVDKDERRPADGLEAPSDHAPLIVDFNSLGISQSFKEKL